MKINTLFNNINEITIENYLAKFGVKDFNIYAKGSTLEDICHYGDTVELWLDKFKRCLESNINIYLLVDSDADGYLSVSMFYVFCKQINSHINLIPLFHKEKGHGLNDDDLLEKIKSLPQGVMIILDGGTNDIKLMKELGWIFLVADHHKQEVENDYKYCYLINNQIQDKVINKGLSGTGVTWKLLREYNPKIANTLISYVFISLLSDSMDLSYDENYSFIKWGKLNIHPNLKPFVDKFNIDDTNKGYSYGMIPKINALIRLGNQENKELLFKTLCGESNQDEIEQCLEICAKLHSSQSSQADSLIKKNIEILHNNKVILAKINVKTALTGLIANKLMSKYNKPILLLHDRSNGECAGSVRSSISLKNILADSELFNYCEGHDCAFGISYQKNQEQDVIEFLNALESLPKPIETVLLISQATYIPKELFGFNETYRDYFGNNIPIPRIYVEPFTLYNCDISLLGVNKRTMTFTRGDTKFIKFNITNELKEQLCLENDKRVAFEVELIGELSYNEFRGKKQQQCTIDKIEFKKIDTWSDVFE